MQELSMNVLDVAENSVAAGATLVAITLSIDTAAKRMTLTITDNGKGMPPEMAARVTDPFCTMNNVAGDPALAMLITRVIEGKDWIKEKAFGKSREAGIGAVKKKAIKESSTNANWEEAAQ